MKEKLVYLAGPIDHSSDPNGWRNRVTERIALSSKAVIRTLTPMRGKKLTDGKWVSGYTVNEIVMRDLGDIAKSDLVLVYIPEWTKVVGTIMEIVYAKLQNKPIFLVSPDTKMFDGPWIKYHVTRCFADLDEATEYIVNELPLWS